MRLFIAEKPELARAIAAGIGGPQQKQNGQIIMSNGNDVITWCFGHLLELCEPGDYDPALKKWAMEPLPIVFRPWKMKPIEDKKDQLNLIIDLAKKSQVIVNAGDLDQEGQHIIDEILVYGKIKKPVKRILITDNSPKTIRKALASLRDNKDFEGMSNSALARSIGDQWYGFNLSRGYTLAGQAKGYQGTLTVGRVQTPILGLVVNRDRQHEGHSAITHFPVSGEFQFSETTFKAQFQPDESAPVDDKKRILDEDFAKGIVNDCQGKPATIQKAKHEHKTASPPLCYNLLTLQSDCNRKFGYKPDEVLAITQKLREQYQLITYNRSDCEYLPESHHADAPNVLAAVSQTAPILGGAIKRADTTIKSRAFNDANISAHHAIVPTETVGNLNQLSDAEQKVYMLIARAYLAQFYPKQEYTQSRLDLDCQGHQFVANGRMMLKPGWLVLYKNDKDNDEVHEDSGQAIDLSTIGQADTGQCLQADCEKKTTKPPPYYTAATLLKDLCRVAKYVKDPKIRKLLLEKDQDSKSEHGGIGTPATRSAILKGLVDRGFLKEKGKQIISTKNGRQFYDVLPEKAKTPDMTALWHEQQKLIEQGKMTVDAFLDELVDYISQEIEVLKTEGLDIKIDGITCPDCKSGILRQLKGKNGKFWGCTRYREGCRASFPDKRNKPDFEGRKTPALSTEHQCTDCGKPLIRRQAKAKTKDEPKRYWWGCSGYPECKETYWDNDGKPVAKKQANAA